MDHYTHKDGFGVLICEIFVLESDCRTSDGIEIGDVSRNLVRESRERSDIVNITGKLVRTIFSVRWGTQYSRSTLWKNDHDFRIVDHASRNLRHDRDTDDVLASL